MIHCEIYKSNTHQGFEEIEAEVGRVRDVWTVQCGQTRLVGPCSGGGGGEARCLAGGWTTGLGPRGLLLLRGRGLHSWLYLDLDGLDLYSHWG